MPAVPPSTTSSTTARPTGAPTPTAVVPGARVSVVVATRDRRATLEHTLRRLTGLRDRATVIVVDNASSDGTPAMVRALFPQVELVVLPTNRGALARDVGVELATTEVVAFADDDSWWESGALDLAADLFDRHPRLAVAVGRTMLTGGEHAGVDAVSRKMRLALIGADPDLPGPSVLGFPACAAICRRSAFLAVGGFSELLFFGGEETLLALDLGAAGWGLVYVDDLVAWHAPAPATHRDPSPRRWARQERNDVLVEWLRRPLAVAASSTARLGIRGVRDPAARSAFTGIVRRLPAALAGRHPIPAELEARFVRAHAPAAEAERPRRRHVA